MSNWFKVPGQGCPVALGGVQCDTNLDCAAYAQQNPQCSSLSTTGTGLDGRTVVLSAAPVLEILRVILFEKSVKCIRMINILDSLVYPMFQLFYWW